VKKALLFKQNGRGQKIVQDLKYSSIPVYRKGATLVFETALSDGCLDSTMKPDSVKILYNHKSSEQGTFSSRIGSDYIL
jgi:hypothetical protein